jgi:hypothetical protein
LLLNERGSKREKLAHWYATADNQTNDHRHSHPLTLNHPRREMHPKPLVATAPAAFELEGGAPAANNYTLTLKRK